MVILSKKFGTLDPQLPIVWDKVPKKRFFTPSLKGKVAFAMSEVECGVSDPHF